MSNPTSKPLFSMLLAAPADLQSLKGLPLLPMLPVTWVLVRADGPALAFEAENGEPLPAEQVMLHAVGGASVSSEGQAHLARVAQAWSGMFGGEAPAMRHFDETQGADASVALLAWLVEAQAASRAGMARHATRLMRELALLRQQHEATQASFRGLEQFVYNHGFKHRMLDTVVSPVAGQLPITLGSGSSLMQLLPGGSAGLSDIAVRIDDLPAGLSGMLSCSLLSTDGKEVVSQWKVPADRLRCGWLRLSLDRALGADPVSLTLHVVWHGSESIRLDTAMSHPESRFRPMVDGAEVDALLAMQVWRWVAGSAAPVPAEAIMQEGGKGRLCAVEPSMLAAALMPGSEEPVPMLNGGEGLLVHVQVNRMAYAILPGVAQPGTLQVFANVRTRHAEGPVVEYALALLPQDRRPRQADEPPRLDLALTSAWARLAPEEDGQVSVAPPVALQVPHDIYLMTRLPDRGRSNAYGWSTFSDIRLRF